MSKWQCDCGCEKEIIEDPPLTDYTRPKQQMRYVGETKECPKCNRWTLRPARKP